MTPGNFPLNLYKGDTYRWQFRLWQDVARIDATDLTGATVTAQIRDRAGGALICSLDCTVTLPNIVDVVLTAANSALLPTSAVWDMQTTFASGDVMTPIAGAVNVTPDVTIPLPPPITLVRAGMRR